MTYTIALLLFHFDLSLAEESVHWGSDMKAYVFWDKPPLKVYAKIANH